MGDDQKGRVGAKWLNLKYELIVYSIYYIHIFCIDICGLFGLIGLV